MSDRFLPRSPGLIRLVLRVLAVTAALALPILGTSYALVSNVSAEIATARTERDDVATFAVAAALLPHLERLHRDVTDATAHDAADFLAANVAMTAIADRFAAPTARPQTRERGKALETAWSAVTSRPSVPRIDAAIAALQDLAGEFDDDSPLGYDPNFAVQDLVVTLFTNTPQAIVRIRKLSDSIATAARRPRDARTLEQIAVARALQQAPLVDTLKYETAALGLEPALAPALRARLAAARETTLALDARVDHLLARPPGTPIDPASIERLARRALDAHLAVWFATLASADRLVAMRLDAQVRNRKIIVALSLFAVLLGVAAISFIGRYLARGDRIELEAAKLESDKLRSELQQITIERALRLQEAQFRSVFENADLGIAIFELDGAIAQYNAAVTAMLGDRRDAVLSGRTAQIAAVRTNREPFTLEESHQHPDGSIQWLALTFSGVYDDDTCQMVIVLVRDTTEEKLLQAGLMHAASHDGLTQIANRTAFEQRLETLLADPAEPFALMYVDLDKFKPVNDNFGHAAGDHVLIATAERIRSALASQDFCARLGGDEFAAIVRGRFDEATLESIALRIGTSIATPIPFGEHDLAITASIGIAVRDAADASSVELKAAADRALYCVKNDPARCYAIAERRRPVAAARPA